MSAIMYKEEWKEKEITNDNVEPPFNIKPFSSFTVNYVYSESELNLEKAFDLVFEEVIKNYATRL